MAAFDCEIVSTTKSLFSAKAEMVVVPGVEGSMGFLAGHAPLVSVLADGEVRLTPEGSNNIQRFNLKGGYVQVSDTKVIILADSCEPVAA